MGENWEHIFTRRAWLQSFFDMHFLYTTPCPTARKWNTGRAFVRRCMMCVSFCFPILLLRPLCPNRGATGPAGWSQELGPSNASLRFSGNNWLIDWLIDVSINCWLDHSFDWLIDSTHNLLTTDRPTKSLPLPFPHSLIHDQMKQNREIRRKRTTEYLYLCIYSSTSQFALWQCAESEDRQVYSVNPSETRRR